MKKNHQHAGADSDKMRIEQAESRAQLAETRTEQAKSRTELAETRTEHAETRTELARTRTEQAEIRTEQAETRTEQAESTLQLLVHNGIDPGQKLSPRLLKSIPVKAIAGQKSPLEQLTIRQREILQLIAEGQNTKQIAAILKISPKTVEYHRMKLMNGLNIHDVPGLVRFALREGLIPQEG
jgi:DNA-binding CsgD family transcriptional regulator